MDLVFPTSARVSSAQWALVSSTAASRSIFTGATRSLQRSGDRFRVGLTVANAKDSAAYALRAQLKTLESAARGMGTRVYVSDASYVQRGSFPAPEILVNSNFASAFSGWSNYNDYAITVNDRICRALCLGTSVNGSNGPGGVSFPIYQNPAFVQYGAYVIRAVVRLLGQGTQTPVVYSAIDTNGREVSIPSGGGYAAISWCAIASGSVGIATNITAPIGSGLEIPFISASRCAVIDTGTNMLLRSDEIDHATWAKGEVTVSANAAQSPDGTANADSLLETTATSTHSVSQTGVTVSSSAADYAFSIALKSNGRSHCILSMGESTGATICQSWFNLSTGAASNGTTGGSNWTNLRTFSTSLGGGWRQYTIIARKVSAATTLTAFVGIASADGVSSYAGNASFGLYAWRATLAQSSYPTRLVQVVNVATTGTSPTGSIAYLKGLPASTSGLLLYGDMVEIYGSGLHRVVSPLSSDGTGLGVLHFEPALHKSTLADNTPVIINTPMGRMVQSSNENSWSERPGYLSDFDFTFEESLDA